MEFLRVVNSSSVSTDLCESACNARVNWCVVRAIL